MIRKIFLSFFLIANLFFASSVFGQAVGDYRSNAAAGNWTTLSSWQYYNGSTWITPSGTSPQGYPGQFVGTGAVFIQYGNTITMGTADLTTSSMGTLTISGKLILDGGGGGGTFTINTPNIIVTPGLTPYANIGFENKVTLALPASTVIEVGVGGLPTPGNGLCNNNIEIQLGGTVLAYCVGTGSPAAAYNFQDLINNGGFNIVNISPTSASACGSGSFSFTATAIPSATATAVRWYSAASGGTPLQTTSGNTSTYITPTITSTTTYYAEATIGAFITPRKAVVATVNSIPSAPSVTTTQPTCAIQTGTITITAVAGETYSFDGGAYSGTLVHSGLIQGSTHTVIAKSASDCISPVANIAINNTTKTWNGSWSPSAPTSADNIIFAGGVFNSTTDLTACSCQVNNSASVVINSGHTLTLTNGLTVIGFGDITFKDKASLVQINNVANSGDITYERKTNTVVRSTDYTYWSSPVSPQTIGDFSPDTPDGMMYSFDSSIDDWKQESLISPMNVGKGYIIRGPEPSGIPIPPAQFTANFVGVPNNGNYSISGILADKSYLLGNPYPSALDADSFLNANAGVLDGTLYFWTHKTQIGTGVNDPGSGYYAYSGDDYASYNSVGGVGAAAISGGAIPTGKIGSGQGFFASTKVSLSGSSIDFNNSMRVGVGGITGNNSQFFKKRNPKTEKVIEKHRIWLNLTNTQGAFKQTLIGYLTDATNDYDSRFDGESFDGNEFVDFYSLNQDKNLVIQGRGLPFDENDEVPLGFRSTINGDFTINIDQTDGLLTNQAVFIEDKLTNTVFDLKSGAYTFNTAAGTFNDRFVLRYTNKTLSTKNFDSLEKKVFVSTKNKQIKISSFAETIDKVTVCDLLGRQVYQKVNVNSNELSIANLASSYQTLVIKTTLQNGETVTAKIIY